MKRWLLVAMLGTVVAGAGILLSLRPRPVLGARVEIGFRELRRLQFDEERRSADLAHQSEAVEAQLVLDEVAHEVLLRALPGRPGSALNALDVSIDERDDYPFRQLLLVRETSPEVQTHLGQLGTLTRWRGELGINGLAAGTYRLVVAPLSFFITNGDGPIARRTNAGAELSPESARHKVFRDIFSRNAAVLPAVPDEWFVWVAGEKRWVRWGSWPAGWDL